MGERFRQQAERSADRTAMVFEDRCWSYAELLDITSRLAGYLRGRGLGPGSVVAIDLQRSPEQVFAVLAVLLAGAAYLPLDEHLPDKRRERLLTISRATLRLASDTPRCPDVSIPTLPWSQFWEESRRCSRLPTPTARPHDLAYVICTSGSTGGPKAVGVSHRAITNQILWRRAAFRLGESHRVLYKAPFGTDVAVGEVLNPLCTGAVVVLAPPGVERDPDQLVAEMRSSGVTIAYFVSSALPGVLDAGLLGQCPALRILNAGAEPLARSVRDEVVAARKGLLWHSYGPTECAITALVSRCGDERREITLDHACTNITAWLPTGNGEAAGTGDVGELYLSGPGLAWGYLGDAARTAQQFVTSPSAGDRLYRTGDLFRVAESGRLEFAGRLDNLVKVGGRRLALEEVETALMEHPSVAVAAVAVRETAEGGRILEAHVLPAAPGSEDELQAFVALRLPPYARPASITFTTALPRLPGGKVDRAALARKAPEMQAGGAESGETNLEVELAGIWCGLLGLSLSEINPAEDLTGYGLNSLSLVRARSRLQARFGVKVGMQELFEARTVRQQTSLVASMLKSSP